MIKTFLLITYLLIGIANTSTASEYHFRNINTADGLSHQQVEALVQDNDGNIWIGTRNGLCRYDGYTMQTYFHNDDDAYSLPHSFIHALLVDSHRRLWICTQEGVCRYLPASDNFKCYTSPHGNLSSIVETAQGKIICGGNELTIYDEQTDHFSTIPSLGYGFIVNLAADRKGNLYVATNKTIYSYNADMSKIRYLAKGYYENFLSGYDCVVPMLFDHAGRLWMGINGNGATCIDIKTGSSKIYDTAATTDGLVRVIREDSHHRIWMGTEKGIVIVNTDGTTNTLRHNFLSSNQLSDNAIYSILFDRDDNAWIGSYFGGVDLLTSGSRRFSLWKPKNDAESICGEVPRQMVETTPGSVWIATEDGGVSVMDMKSRTFSQFKTIPQIGSNVHCLYYDRLSADLWIGTFRHGLFRYNLITRQTRSYGYAQGLPSVSIFSIAAQRNGRLWVATTSGLRLYDSSTDTFRPIGNNVVDKYFAYTLCIDKADNLWVGMSNKGLYLIDSHSTKAKLIGDNKTRGLKDNYITTLFEDKNGRVWVGTNNNGLYYYNRKIDTFVPFANTILPQKITICSINEDMQGRLWIGTGSGLYLYTRQSGQTLRLTTTDGLPTNQFNFQSSLITSDGTMLIGTVRGLVGLHPADIVGNAKPLRVYMKRLVINSQVMNASTSDSPLTKTLDNEEEIHLSHSQARTFSVEYGVIQPSNASSVRYMVMFEGIDKSWRDVGTERTFHGYNLSSGTYHLHVKANNGTSGWDNCPEKVLTIVVEPPFYLSIWAYLFYILLASVSLAIIFRMASERIKERNALRMANIEKEKMKEMDKERADFFTAVTHELKTPLSLIEAPLKCVMRSDVTTQTKRNIETALRSASKMERIISELVTFNKMDADTSPFYVQKGNPMPFAANVAKQYCEMAKARQITFSYNGEDNGEEVWFAPNAVERILDNLISNAFKFTPDGGSVDVKCSVEEGSDGKAAFLRLEVVDTGIGIASEEKDKIFRRYYQTKRGYNVNNGGWGIGLSLVKMLAERHKGTVSMESELGKGSRFTVMLNVQTKAFGEECRLPGDKKSVKVDADSPTTPLPDVFPDSDHDRAESEDGDGGTILFVEDNVELTAFLVQYYSRAYTVITTSDGAEALRLAHERDVQIVVADVMMPTMDGLTLCRRLKGDLLTSHIPIILLTAKDQNTDVVEGYRSGADGYLTKPFDPTVLELQIRNITRLYKMRQRKIANATSEDLTTIPMSDSDKDFIRRLGTFVDSKFTDSDFSIADITQELGVSRSMLYVKMKNLVGMSMGDYIRKKRLDMARKLLAEGHNVSEVAYRSGFTDPNYFSKTFKKYVGITPSEYITMLEKEKNN